MSNPLTNETFFEFVRAHRFVVVHFWAAWNGLDHLMNKLLETEIAADLRAQIAFANLDMDPAAHHQLGTQHQVLNLPFLAFYRDGVLMRSVTGMLKPEVISEYLSELIGEVVD